MIVKTIQHHPPAEWGQLDYLLVDLPPGTGDAQRRSAVPLDGGVIVTTPRKLHLGCGRALPCLRKSTFQSWESSRT